MLRCGMGYYGAFLSFKNNMFLTFVRRTSYFG